MPDPGPPVPDGETLHRVITPAAAAVWFPTGTLSSAALNYPVFSVDVAGLGTVTDTLSRWPAGSGVVAVNCGEARRLGFDARHEPEQGNTAHANVYCRFPNSERKRRARQLASGATLLVAPGLVPG